LAGVGQHALLNTGCYPVARWRLTSVFRNPVTAFDLYGDGAVRRGCRAAPRKRASNVKPLGPSENQRFTPERLAQDRAIRSASPRVAQPNWSGPGTARMANDGVVCDPLLWITTSPLSGILSGMLASRETHLKVLLVRSAPVQNDLERRRLCGVSEGDAVHLGSLVARSVRPSTLIEHSFDNAELLHPISLHGARLKRCPFVYTCARVALVGRAS
jgi:hypothetical protein